VAPKRKSCSDVETGQRATLVTAGLGADAVVAVLRRLGRTTPEERETRAFGVDEFIEFTRWRRS
jgi:hypothetical protein